MKYKIGPTGDELEIGQYREVNTGCLKAMFSMIIYSPPPFIKGDKTLNCKYFVQGEKRWFNFPAEKREYQDGRKPDYFPYRSYMDKEYLEHLRIAVLEALKNISPKGNNVQEKPQNYPRPQNPLPTEPSFDFGQPPF